MRGILSWSSRLHLVHRHPCPCPDPSSSDMATNGSSANQTTLPATSSRCLPRSITTTHNFEVINFSLLDGMGIGNCIESSTFSVGGCDWSVAFYPDGSLRTNRAGYASVFLCFLGGPEGGVRAKFSLSLLDKDNKVLRTKAKSKGTRRKVWRAHGAHTFEHTDDYWGWCRFIHKSKLRELLRVSGDRFTIRCVLTVIQEGTAADVGTIVVPPSSLHQDLSRMLEDERGADVHFMVQDQVFPAHRNVLAARSRVFEAELFGDMESITDPQQYCIGIDDMEPEVFECLLHFVYTDCIPDNCIPDEIVPTQRLLVAADRYGLGRLRLLCEEKLSRWIDVQSVARTLALAEQHKCVQLKDACVGFIASRDVLGAVMETEGFKHLIARYPLIMKEILDKIASTRTE
ncbi:unnamed protein product [Urochloa decumbens]|uniref:Uncharacterized protein n=1 Tax=Urochloa decumbens TaxID=240449 RepID=A0ABC9D1H6_9POAL